MVTLRILGTNARTITFPHVGRVTLLIPFQALEKLRGIRTEHVPPPSTKQGDSALFHTVLQGGLSCLYHVPLGYLSFICVAQVKKLT